MTVTLEQIAGLKLRLTKLPEELLDARRAALDAREAVKAAKNDRADAEAEIVAVARAACLEQAKGKAVSEAALTAAGKAALGADTRHGAWRRSLATMERERDLAELAVQHLEAKFAGLQAVADLTAAEVRLLIGGLGA